MIDDAPGRILAVANAARAAERVPVVPMRNGLRVSAPKPRETPLRKRAKQTGKRRLSKLVYRDSFGVSFAESRLWLPALAKDWIRERPMSDLQRPAVLKFVHQQVDAEAIVRCWLCEQAFLSLEAHHVVSRWDFVGNICMVCTECHKRVQHNQEALPEVLRACWKFNKLALSWVHLVRARGKWWGFDSLD